MQGSCVILVFCTSCGSIGFIASKSTCSQTAPEVHAFKALHRNMNAQSFVLIPS
jgi:hypothetical protein